jgi:hypothetical protein
MDIPLISLISCVMSRLSYFDNTIFLNKYLQIFNIPELNKQIINLKHEDIINIFDLKIKNMIQINKKINIINYNDNDNDNDNDKSNILSSENVQYISISTSNYSGVYVVANKLINTIFVCFRGTYSVKSGLSYLKLSSIKATNICDGSSDGYLLGVFKIISEIFYTIEESINYLSTHFLKTSNTKIVTTGHSLGGGAANIFSYLWIKHKPELKIVCITFGSPRVMNRTLIEKFNQLIHNKVIMFKRYITNGDPFAKLPITSKKFNNSYYFPDDYDESLNYVAITCNNIKKTKKVICNLKNTTKKRKNNIKYHGMYLGILLKGAAGDKLDLHKEIKRDTNNDTICRIIIGGNNKKFRVVFFNLTDAKMKKKGLIISKIEKIKKTFFKIDYNHQDIYINKKMFEKLIKSSSELDDENLSPLMADKIIKIQHKDPKQELNCI